MQSEKYIIEFFKSTGKIPKFSGFRFEDPFQTAFKLPPERALEWLKQRGKNLKITSDWDELDAEAHDKAFTVAKVMSADILQLIYDYVERAKSEGMTIKQFQDSLLPELEKKGWTGATPSRLKVIYDTNMQMAYAQGKYKQQKLISHLYPYWKYTQIQRPTKRHNHSLLHGRVFRHDDPIWDLIYPPSGFGCKCSVTPIKDGNNAEEGSKYLRQLRRSKDFTLHPAYTWKVETSKYVKGLRNQLDKMLNNENKIEIINSYDTAKKYKLKKGERDPLELIDVLENGYKITDGDRYAVRSWQQGKEYYQYILAKDIDKHEDFDFRGNDIIKERKRIEAEKIYNLLENLINNSPNYDKELYKIVHKNKFKLDEDNTILFPTKESWTKSLEGMGSFVNENTILLVLESGNKTNKLTDIVGIGDGGWDISENEVISQKNSKFKILKTENIIFKTYDKNYKMKKITITSI